MRTEGNPIRVGMIRCDVHACWYGLLFAPADEDLTLRHFPQCQYYFYYRHQLKFGMVPGFKLTKVYDPFPVHDGITRDEGDTRSNAEVLSEIFLDKPEVCESLDELSEGVDLVFIADCLENGRDHLELATPGLEKGLPTFVDKPFAHGLADVRAMIELAKRNDTPILSTSLLRMNPKGDEYRSRFAEIDPVGMGVVKGVGFTGLNATIHGLSLAQHVFGGGVDWVQSMGVLPLEFVRLHQPRESPDLPHGVDVCVISSYLQGPNCGYRCEAYSKVGSIHSEWINDYNFPLGGIAVLEKLRKMVETREPQMPYESMLELFEIVEAARISQEQGSQPVHLRDVRAMRSEDLPEA